MKKFLALILTLALAGCILVSCDSGEGNEKENGETEKAADELAFELNEDGKSYTLTGIGTYTSTDIVITDYKGLPVTRIEAYAFRNKNITSVTIPDSVTVIDAHAFAECTALKTVTVGSGVTEMCNSAFWRCSGITEVYYNGDVESWCNIKFTAANSNPVFYAKKLYTKNDAGEYELLTSLAIPDTVTEIKENAFVNCASITEVTFPSDLIGIGKSAFCGCEGITSITIPASTQYINPAAFTDCTGLTDVEFENVKNWYGSTNEKTGGTPISESDLANNTKAAKLLTDTYAGEYLKVIKPES